MFAPFWYFLCVLPAVFLSGCEPSAPVQRTQATRVVSLAPALTRMLAALERDHLIVGVGHNDNAAPSDARVVGHFMDINAEALVTLAPTHVVAMFGNMGGDARLAALAVSGAFELVSYPYPRSATDVLRILQAPSVGSSVEIDAGPMALGPLLGLSNEADHLVRRIEGQLAAVAAATRGRERPRVLMLFDVETLMAAGPGEVLDDLLTCYAGGINATGSTAVRAPTFDREKLVAADPEVILLLTPGRLAFGAIAEDPRLAVLRDLPVAAVREGRVRQLCQSYILLPSTDIARIAAVIAEAVHGPLPAVRRLFPSAEALVGTRTLPVRGAP